MTNRLEGKLAFCTASGAGIGRATAIAFAREGAEVVLTHLPGEEEDGRRTAELVEQAGRRAVTAPGDARLASLRFVAVGGALLWPLVLNHPLFAYPVLFVWGGVFVGIYTLMMAVVGSRFEGAELVGIYAVMGLVWGLGALLGPALGALAVGFGLVEWIGGERVTPGIIAVLLGATGMGNLAFYLFERRLK